MSNAEEFIEAARVFLAEEAYEEGFLLMSEAIDLDPLNTDYLIERSQAYCDLRDYEAALADCDKALTIDPHFEKGYSFRSFIYELMGEYDKAIDDTNELLDIVSRYPVDLYVHRAHLFTRKGDYISALADYDFVIEWNPKHPNHYLQRGLVFMALKRFDSAKKDFQHLIDTLPKEHLLVKTSQEHLAEIEGLQKDSEKES